MAWVTSGSSIYSSNYLYPDGLPSGANYKQRVYSFSMTCDSDSCLYVKKFKPNSKNITNYEVFCVKRKTGTLTDGVRDGTLTERFYGDIDTNVTNFTNQPFNNFNVYSSGSSTTTVDNKRVIILYTGTTSLPVFDNADAITAYITNGDTSGAIKDVKTDWTLYIDGSSNPLYKLTWNCEGVKDLDLSNSIVKLWVGKFNSLDDSITDIVPFRDIPYTDGRTKFSYSDISKLVEQPMIGHNPACLIVRFGYREFSTAQFETSTRMACDLYFNKSAIGTLYDSLGYVALIDGVTKRTTNGDGSTFTVKDGQDGSDGYTDDNDGGYDDGKDNDDQDSDTSDVSAGIGVLTSTFKMTKERLIQLGQFLWGASIFDKFSLVNNNPIENIVSCKSIPIALSGTNQEIVLGNVATSVNGEKISNNFGKQTIGSVMINEYYKNFLDYSPYTNVILYLPYIGFKELDTSMVMNKTIKVEYTVDVITGGCLAQISVNNIKLYEFTGNVGIDIPITASNRAQVEAGYIQAGVGAGLSAMSGNISGTVGTLVNSATSQYHYSSTGNPSPMCVASTNRTCYVIIDRPQYQTLKAFNHTRGRMCCLSKTIGTLKGYTICDRHVDLSGISATDTEKEELIDILSSGFFV